MNKFVNPGIILLEVRDEFGPLEMHFETSDEKKENPFPPFAFVASFVADDDGTGEMGQFPEWPD